jgi:2-polyprenyl-6-methoxyphenol hydroxylase-like FAD-dependent oxidoreductase
MTCGAERRVYDKLIAIWAIFENVQSDSDVSICQNGYSRQTYVEGMADGWLYTAPIPDGRRVVAYFTDGDADDLLELRSAIGFLDRVRSSRCMRSEMDLAGCELVYGPTCVNAASSCLSMVYGNNWIAAGDAAQSFDPLASQGIISAIVSGCNAAGALISAQSVGVRAFKNYQADLADNYNSYLYHRKQYYGMEQRWRGHPFWLRRHSVVEPVFDNSP